MENKNQISELIALWQDLCFETKKRNKVDFAVFKDAFSKTYDLLCQSCAEESLSRDYVELVAEAYLFAKLDLDLDSKYLATVVLTERMLNCCAFTASPVAAKDSTVYTIGARKEVLISFKDVDESIITLENVINRIGLISQ